MNIHEFQAKTLFSQYAIPTLKSVVIENSDEVASACSKIGNNIWVVKAQVHTGGRGKGGGVIVCHSIDEVKIACEKLLGSYLVTPQTTNKGLIVKKILIEQGVEIKKELYLSFLIDRQTQKIMILSSTAGGMNIEEVAKNNPEKIIKTFIDPLIGLASHQCRALAFKLGLETQIKDFSILLQNLYRLFTDLEINLIEINPLIIDTENKLIPLDAKVEFDDSALFRHPNIAQLHDKSQEEAKENLASENQLNYIALDGNIGCMVNGAGLAMATMDLIKHHGGEPANFLDVGGGTTAQRVKTAFDIISSDKKVKVILVNIFGGIVRCDLIAQGILDAIEQSHLDLPLVIRLEGTNAEAGLKLLNDSPYSLTTESDLNLATQKAISLL
jgi:succinyl-CoA synthetase beta subunit